MKRLLVLLLILFCCGILTACQSNRVLRCDIPSPITNLDPQFATQQEARTIISNTFEGLVRLTASGEIEPALAEDYTISQDQCTYTFSLRRDAVWTGNGLRSSSGGWESGQPVTSYDFAFALRRMFDLSTPSPFATEFRCLQNASQVLDGKLTPSALGISTPDAYTLVLRLDSPDRQLLLRLAASYAMPCNEAFFRSTSGRYGLGLSNLLFNGPLYLRDWSDTLLSLRPNSSYFDKDSVPTAGVTFTVTQQDAQTRFFSGDSDLAAISTSALSSASSQGATVYPFENTVWVLLFNQNWNLGTEEDPLYPFANTPLRLAIAHTVDRQLFSGNLPTQLRSSSTLIPPSIFFAGWPYRTLAGETSSVVYSPDLAKQYLMTALEDLQLEKLPSLQLLICEEDGQPALAGYVQQGITRNLSTYCGLERLPREQLLSRVESGQFQMAILPISAGSPTPESILSRFSTGASNNFSGYSDPQFDQLLELLNTCPEDQLFANYKQAETYLLETAAAVPLYFETTCYAHTADISGLEVSPFPPYWTFRNAVKS